MSNMSRTKTTKKWKFFNKNERNASKKPATSRSLLSQSYPAAHRVFEGACQIAKWQNKQKPSWKTGQNISRIQFQWTERNNPKKTVQTSKPEPFSSLDHPICWNHVPHEHLWGPGASPSATAVWSSSVASTFHVPSRFLHVPPKRTLHSFIFLHVPSFLGLWGVTVQNVEMRLMIPYRFCSYESSIQKMHPGTVEISLHCPFFVRFSNAFHNRLKFHGFNPALGI